MSAQHTATFINFSNRHRSAKTATRILLETVLLGGGSVYLFGLGWAGFGIFGFFVLGITCIGIACIGFTRGKVRLVKFIFGKCWWRNGAVVCHNN